ncbi:metallophosphoesterase [Galbibacter pacificus]|uniref:Metallophosphoesterase n=1 Tax=Galbibacter pacificus TaxID=2996052 RepID=A0ABT6FTI4_9FLAO|nr:metallophosphoesterase [Galbibacter pacificus]MDG3583084.1 metallophosphoesterase [Galbibacter pacificus]MDG3586565.1 metallophosphoesterase [Galbibacter pacificus]
MSRFFIVLGIIYLIGAFYGFQAFRTLVRNPYLQVAYALAFVAVLVNVYLQFNHFDRSQGMSHAMGISVGLFLAFMTLGFFSGIFMLIEDLGRLFGWLFGKIFQSGAVASNTFPSRRKFISRIALGVAAVPFLSLLYGMYKGKYDYQVLKYTLEFDDLPDAFDGYRITQISDIHSGSFDNKKKIEYVVDLINKQASDVLLFTGDLVNNVATEMHPWKETFSRLHATDGVFSVLGNHDYGDYAEWPSEEAKKENLDELKKIQKDMGFDLLLNESRYLEKDGQRIALIGVENWGEGGFKKAGDLEKAIKNIKPEDFKILMSHDPSHWQYQVLEHPYHYHLTLSGHTHGMQFGVEIPGVIKWSPVKYRYKYWAGVYEKMGQFINVNRGLGFIGYPGRVGIWPEITVIELKKKIKPVV